MTAIDTGEAPGALAGFDVPVALTRADSALQSLVPLLDEAVLNRKLVAAIGSYRYNPVVGLIPFHLHLRWPDAVPSLPLNAKFSLLCLSDRGQEDVALYSPVEAMAARRRARTSRRQENRGRREDFAIPDWERVLLKQTTDGLTIPARLPGASLLAVDRLTRTGTRKPGSRGFVGAHAPRDAPRVSLLALSSNVSRDTDLTRIFEADILVIDAQLVRGHRTLGVLGQALERRPEQLPTLLVVSGPQDLMSVAGKEIPSDWQLTSTGPARVPECGQVHLVDRGRELREREFEFANQGQPGEDAHIGLARCLAKSAWWAIHQSVDDARAGEPEVQRLQTYLRHLPQDRVSLDRQLGMVGSLLDRTAKEEGAVNERRRIVTEAALGCGYPRLLVLTRGHRAARVLRDLAAAELGVSAAELTKLGVLFRPFGLSLRQSDSADHVLLCGYYGKDSIQAALAPGPTRVDCIVDPVEARALHVGLEILRNYVQTIGATELAGPLDWWRPLIAKHAPAGGDAEDLNLDFDLVLSLADRVERSTNNYAPQLGVEISDGQLLVVPANARFDVLRSVDGADLGRATASELVVGDEVVLLRDDAQAGFSDRLLAALDEGQLGGVPN